MKLKVLVPLAAAAAFLAGCSPTPGTAVNAGGQELSVAEVNRMYDGCTDVMGAADPQFTPATIVHAFVASVMYDKAVAEFSHLATTDAQMEAQLKQLAPDLMSNEDCAQAVRYISKSGGLNSLPLTQEDGQALFSDFEVEFNPRYGRINQTGGADSLSGSLSVPAEQQ